MTRYARPLVLAASSRRASGWCRAVVCSLALWGAVGIPLASAQAPPPCDPLLAAAEGRYVKREFAEAETLVRACLAQNERSDEAAVLAYRLLALIALRQDDLPEAKRAVLQIVGVSFEYEPDPVQDPPSFVALVKTIKGQLRKEQARPLSHDSTRVAPPEREPEPTPRVPSASGIDVPNSSYRERYPIQYRVAGTFELSLALEAGSYNGERSADASNPFQRFSENGGASLAVAVSYSVTQENVIVLTYRFFNVPTLSTNTAPGEVPIRPEDSSEWTQLLSVLGRRLFAPNWRLTPTIQIGFAGLLSHLNGQTKVGIGPQLGFGLDAALTSRLGAFGELNATIIYPGDVIDRVDTDTPFGDPLIFAGGGLRYRLNGR